MQVQAETDTNFLVIPAPVYKTLMHESLPVANFTNQLMASRFTEVMWLLDQILSKSFDARLAAFLLEEAGVRQSMELPLTHEQIAGHLGTAGRWFPACSSISRARARWSCSGAACGLRMPAGWRIGRRDASSQCDKVTER